MVTIDKTIGGTTQQLVRSDDPPTVDADERTIAIEFEQEVKHSDPRRRSCTWTVTIDRTTLMDIVALLSPPLCDETRILNELRELLNALGGQNFSVEETIPVLKFIIEAGTKRTLSLNPD